MKNLSLEAVAADIVDAIKPLIGNRTLNVMNTGGVIVASSDPDRVGTFHKGAAVAASLRQVVRINPSEVALYPGAKEGINMPVVKNGKLLGVVGIYGVPEEVEQAANLLCACVGLYLDQAQAARKTQFKKDMRLTFVRRMLLGEMLDSEELIAGGRELGLDLRLPMRAIVVTAGRKNYGRGYALEFLDRAYCVIECGGLIDDRRDVLAVVDDELVLFKHTPAGFDPEAFARALHQKLGERLGEPVTAALGGQCDDWRQLALSRREAGTLAEIYSGECACIDSGECRIMYMLKGCLRLSIPERCLSAPYQGLLRGFGAKEMDRVMETIRVYCDAGCNCGRAAHLLGIHKNTMNYRMNKIFTLAGLDGDPFAREFFLRLLMLHHRCAADRRS